MNRELERRSEVERWISWVRLLAVPFALVEVGFLSDGFPAGYERWAWTATAALGVGAVVLWLLARRGWSPRGQTLLALGALGFDVAIVGAFVVIFYAWEPNTPVRQVLFLPVAEAAVRFGIVGGIVVPLLLAPFLAWGEALRADHFNRDFDVDAVAFPLGVEIIMGLVVGWLAARLQREAVNADARAAEAEELRDQLGHRADQLEAVNRVSRALAASLDQEAAFDGFLRELRGVFGFARLAIVLAEGEDAVVMANSGRETNSLYPTGTARPIAGSVLEDILGNGRTVVRGDMDESPRYPEERELARIGLRSRVVAPVAVGDQALGMVSVSREARDAFTAEEIDLIALLGRQLGNAVQNMRAYAAERHAAEELRRLSALRADFVSLVSHELRTPMAAVIGCAATLRRRWRELAPAQRESFLTLIEQETGRLSTLIGDVLDTSRIEAGTFTYIFADVDLAELVRETASMVELGTDEVRVQTVVRDPLPAVRGDRERLRQLLLNLVSNAAKYTVSGDEVEVRAGTDDGYVVVTVVDHGPGIPVDQQRLIFEKFGRVNSGGRSKTGAGLGLFIARSIAEAHGGTLDVESEPGSGAAFVFRLPTA
ncbi:MAG TPA: ATP-binding protein [Gaiellaceae bacterium]|jgi:signal transduction histidine kinase